MEKTYLALKAYIEEQLPGELGKLATEDTPLPMPDRIVFGVADLSRYEQKILCVITPESEDESGGTIADGEKEQSFTVGFICRGRSYDVLIRQMCRYALAFQQVMRGGWSLGGKVRNVAMGKTEYYPDAGTTEKQMTAAETSLLITAGGDVAGGHDPFDDEEDFL